MKSNDPRSIYYERKLEYNKINYCKLIIYFIFLFFIMLFINKLSTWHVVLIIGLYVLLSIKHFVLLIIKIYQYLAPVRIRNKCRFEPSCSQYMFLSVQKYGVIKGIIKGIKRIRRCNVNGGGYDYP